MRYWWVNQNQTYRHEVAGGYLWSPKRNKGDRLNPFYETMREVAPGDIEFSVIFRRHAVRVDRGRTAGAGRHDAATQNQPASGEHGVVHFSRRF